MLTDQEIRKIAQGIVNKAKATAHYDQGSLFRSIAFTYVRGEVIFRQLFYGQWNDNSKLEEIASREMPNGVPWKIIYTKLGGGTYEVGRTKMGRKKQSSSIITAVKNTSGNILSLIKKIKNRGKKEK